MFIDLRERAREREREIRMLNRLPNRLSECARTHTHTQTTSRKKKDGNEWVKGFSGNEWHIKHGKVQILIGP